MANFGDTNLGGEDLIVTDNRIAGGLFTLPQDGDATSITAALNNPTNTRNAKCAIYNSSLAFVAETEEKNLSVNASEHHETFNFTSPVSLVAGDYILALWSDNILAGSCSLFMEIEDTGINKFQTATYGTFPSLLAPTTGTQLTHIYCTYTPSPYTKINKPTNTNYTYVNFSGREQYDQSSVFYDDSSIFYDGVNYGAYTSVAKPTDSSYTTVAKPTS